MRPEEVKMLCCPETREALELADSHVLTEINECIRAGGVVTVAGSAVTEHLEGALLCEKAARIYPIKGDIPVLLSESALRWPESLVYGV